MSLATVGFKEVPIAEEYIDDATMESLCAAIALENLNPDELDEFTSTMESMDVVTEKTIVKLDKKAKKNHAYKVGILKAAAERNDKDLKKLRKLWKLEAVLFKKLEKRYKNKATAYAKSAMLKMGRSSAPTARAASIRAGKRAPSAKNLGGTNKLLHK